MITIREEQMNHCFTKWHIEGGPFKGTVHKFSEVDTFPHPHTHPYSFRSLILHGYYVEEVFDAESGRSTHHLHEEGDCFTIHADHIHKIVEVSEGGVFTFIKFGEWEKTPGFWDFRDTGSWYRDWNGEWSLIHPKES